MKNGVLVAVGLVLGGQGLSIAQTADLVREVRAAVDRQDFTEGEQRLVAYREEYGVTPEYLEAHSWLGRGALAAGRYAQADAYASQTHDMVREMLTRRTLDEEPRLPVALGAAIEVRGHAAAETGARSAAVAFLERELDTYRTTSIARRIQKNLNLLSLEGTLAPPLDQSEGLGARTLSFDDVKGKVALVFFWAHWCPDCKRQGPILEVLLDEYGDRGLTVVAPTQRYGYVAGGEDASPDEEKAYIRQIRDTYYGFLSDESVLLAEANHLRYGVSSTPTIVLLDRAGVVRLYHPGDMTAEELEPIVERYLAAAPN